MRNKEVAVRLAEQNKEIGSLKHRMNECEEQHKLMNKLVSSVDKLAMNMEQMFKEQQEQGNRLLKLEQAPADEFRYYKKKVVSKAFNGIIGALLGAVFAMIIK